MATPTARIASLCLTLACVLAGCATATGENLFDAGRQGTDLTLVAQNQSPDVQQIALVIQGVAHPIGRVEGLAEARFAIGRYVSAGYDDLRIEAGPLRREGQQWTSPRLQLDGVDIVTVLLRSQLSMSTYALSSRQSRD